MDRMPPDYSDYEDGLPEEEYPGHGWVAAAYVLLFMAFVGVILFIKALGVFG